MAYTAGVAFVQVVPSLKDFNKTIGREVDSLAPAAGARAGKQMGAGMAGGLAASGSAVASGAGKAAGAAAGVASAAGATAGSGFIGRLGASIAGGVRVVGAATAGLFGRVAAAASAAGAAAGGGFLKSMTRTLGPLAAAFAPIAVLGAGFKRLANIEDAQAKLRGLGHTAETVTRVMQNALAAVKGTAFGLDEAATVAAGLLAAGIKPGAQLERVLKLVADSATIAGTSMGEMGAIWNKVAASGKIQGDVIAQLGDRGIPILQLLADEMGVKNVAAVQKMASEGKIGFDQFSRAMEAGMAGAALKSGETTRGTLQNVAAAISRLGAAVVGEFFPLIKTGGAGTIQVLDAATEKLPVITARVKAIVGPAFTGFTKWVRDNAEWLKPLVVGLGGAAAAIVTVRIAVAALLLPLQLLTITVRLLTGAMLANPVGIIVGAIGALIAVLIYSYQHFEGFRSVVDATWAGIVRASQWAWQNVLKPVFAALVVAWDATASAAKTVWGAVVQAWGGMSSAVSTSWTVIQAIWTGMKWYLTTLGTAALWVWRNVYVPAWNGIAAVVAFAWNNVIKPYLTALKWYFDTVVAPVVMWFWRNVWSPAWSGIVFAARVAWNVLKLAFDLIVYYFRNILAPTMLWLWRNIFSVAWTAISVSVTVAWNVIRAVFNAYVTVIKATVAPVVMWLWQNVISPAWAAISTLISFHWNIIKTVFGAIVAMVKMVLGPTITWLWQNVVKPGFDAIGTVISVTWNSVIRPAFDALVSVLKNQVVAGFQSAVNTISTIWNGLRDIATRPVNFIIETVYNNGIRRVFQQVAEAIGSSARLPLATPVGGGGAVSTSAYGPVRGVAARAKGGWTPPGWTLVGEEGPELVDFATPGRVYTAADTARMIGDGPGDALSAVANVLRDPLGAVGNLASNLLGRVPGVGQWVDLLKGVGGKIKDMVVQKVKDLLGDMAEGIIGQAGGGGGLGWQWMWNTVKAAFPGARLHSAFRPGAITATGNASWHGKGRAIDVTPSMDIFNWIARNFGAKTLELIYSPAGGRQIHRGKPHMYTGVTRAMHFDHVHWAYDEGGWMPPGVRSIANMTGKPEAVLNPRQWDDIHSLAQRGAAGIQFNGPLQALDPRELAVEVERRIRQRQTLYAGVI